jgi:hypothetical protein
MNLGGQASLWVVVQVDIIGISSHLIVYVNDLWIYQLIEG